MAILNPKSTHIRSETAGGTAAHNTPCPGVFQWGMVECSTCYRRKLEIRRECPVCGRREVWRGRLWNESPLNPFPGVDMRLFLSGSRVVVRP